jgi:hypothetical protein
VMFHLRHHPPKKKDKGKTILITTLHDQHDVGLL